MDANELRGRGITNDALHTTLDEQGKGGITQMIQEGEIINGMMFWPKSTKEPKVDLIVSVYAKELMTRANVNAEYVPLTELWDRLESKDGYDYVTPAHIIVTDFQDEGASPYVGKEGIQLRKRVEWKLMQAIKNGKGVTLYAHESIEKLDWYSAKFRAFMQDKLQKMGL